LGPWAIVLMVNCKIRSDSAIFQFASAILADHRQAGYSPDRSIKFEICRYGYYSTVIIMLTDYYSWIVIVFCTDSDVCDWCLLWHLY